MMWLREPAAPINAMQFRSVNSSMVAGVYAMGTGFQLGVFDGTRNFSHEIHFEICKFFQDGNF